MHEGDMMIVKHALLSEKAVNLIETQNKLVFIVDAQATKQEIAQEVEKLYKVKVTKVNTNTTMKGEKRAFVTLAKEDLAADLATQLNII